jgi:predicted acetyltransferase
MSAAPARLVRPATRYHESFLEALAEDHREERLAELSAGALHQDFEGYVVTLRSQEDPTRIASGFVPQSTFWLLDHDRYVGCVSLHHALNDDLCQIGGHVGLERVSHPVTHAPFFKRLATAAWRRAFLQLVVWSTFSSAAVAIRPTCRRRGYGTAALRLGLEEARKPGADRVLVTCDAANARSWRIIEANSGTLQDCIAIDSRDQPTCRYWIDLR